MAADEPDSKAAAPSPPPPSLPLDDAVADAPLARVERFRCLPAGLCELCSPQQAKDASCLAFGRHRPLTCISLTPIEAAQPSGETSTSPSDDLQRRQHSTRGEQQLSLYNYNNATSFSAAESAPEGGSQDETGCWNEAPHPTPRRRQWSKRDFFWTDRETPAKKAAKIIARVDWDAVREEEARSQGVRDQGVRFTSWAPCARVISKERSDFGEFVVSQSGGQTAGRAASLSVPSPRLTRAFLGCSSPALQRRLGGAVPHGALYAPPQAGHATVCQARSADRDTRHHGLKVRSLHISILCCSPSLTVSFQFS